MHLWDCHCKAFVTSPGSPSPLEELSPHCRAVPVTNLTRGRGRRGGKKQSRSNQWHLLHLQSMLGFFFFSEKKIALLEKVEKRRPAKRSRIWIGSFNCVRPGQILLMRQSSVTEIHLWIVSPPRRSLEKSGFFFFPNSGPEVLRKNLIRQGASWTIFHYSSWPFSDLSQSLKLLWATIGTNNNNYCNNNNNNIFLKNNS